MKTTPTARFENIVVQELENEILICNLSTDKVFCLNKTAGEIWKLCNGENNADQIAEILGRKFGGKVSTEMVFVALDELSKENLLESKFSTENIFPGVSRREVIRKAGLASMIALPLISSVVMPSSAQAQSGVACVSDANCPANQWCNVSICVLDLLPGAICSRNGQCTSGNCDTHCCTSSVACPNTCDATGACIP